MKDNLTKQQQEIIDYLAKEFSTLNAPQPIKPFNIVDYNILNNKVDKIAQGVKELKICNSAAEMHLKMIVEKNVDELNNDFRAGNLPIVASSNYYLYYGKQMHIKINGINNFPCGDISIVVAASYLDTSYGNELHVSENDITYVVECIGTFDTLKVLFLHIRMQNKLVGMIQLGRAYVEKSKAKA